MHVLLVGGGSGGHITPNLAVARALKRRQPRTKVSYVGQTGEQLADIARTEPAIDRVYSIRAGKLRRYHGEGWRQLLDLRTGLLNLRDMLYVAVGTIQSLRLLRRCRPDVIFLKGGFVGVPVGLAAALLRVPFVTHDSDVLPGLANRIVGRWARWNAVAFPVELYAYPAAKRLDVGVPVAPDYRPYTAAELAAFRRELGLDADGRLLLVTGGGLGAQRLNQAVVRIAARLLKQYPGLQIRHMAGRALAAETAAAYETALPAALRERVVVAGYSHELPKLSAVAEAVVTRAGSNSLAEYAALAKPCVVVPNPQLTGGHQTKNAEVLASREAALVVRDGELAARPEALLAAVRQLLDNPAAAARLGRHLQELSRPDAADRLAVLLLEDKPATGTVNHVRTQ